MGLAHDRVETRQVRRRMFAGTGKHPSSGDLAVTVAILVRARAGS
jgi:hypothetical protein